MRWVFLLLLAANIGFGVFVYLRDKAPSPDAQLLALQMNADQVRIVPKSEELEVHPGRGGREKIDFDPTAHFVNKLERYPRWVQFYDVNGDGLMDVILHHAGSVGFMVTRKR